MEEIEEGRRQADEKKAQTLHDGLMRGAIIFMKMKKSEILCVGFYSGW